MKKQWTILLVDDHELFREGLKALLERVPDIKAIYQAYNGASAITKTKELSPDIVIIDLAMPDMTGIEATGKIKEISPATEIIALSMHSDKRFMLEMIHAGAREYIQKDTAFDELILAIERIQNNEKPSLIKELENELSELKETKQTTLDINILTRREKQVLHLIAKGNNTRDLAKQLNISYKTAETHRKNVMDKLNTYTIAELTKIAFISGISELDPNSIL
ncbi:MAG: response regulator transcription factor [Spirochaetales bacterium]|nr:response regulator transcription factor [Spirochaetales bacterium]